MWCRISATDGLEESLSDNLRDIVRHHQTRICLADHGAGAINVSSTNDQHTQKFFIRNAEAFQALYFAAIKDSVSGKCLVGPSAGSEMARPHKGTGTGVRWMSSLSKRWLQRNPAAVWQFAGEPDMQITVVQQTEWPFIGRGSSV